MAIHSDRMNDNTKGKAVYILHVAGDELWLMGSKATAPDLGPKQPQQLDKEGSSAEPQQQVIDETPGTAEPSQGSSIEEPTSNDPPEAAEVLKQKKELAPQGCSSLHHISYHRDSQFL
jgi:hypothetical protein